MVVGSVEKGITEDIEKVMAKCREGKGYGLTVLRGNYNLQKIPPSYHRVSDRYEIVAYLVEIGRELVINCSVEEKKYDGKEFVDILKNRLQHIFEGVSFDEYRSSDTIQSDMDTILKYRDDSDFPLYLVFNIENEMLYLWGLDIERNLKNKKKS